MPPLCAAMAMLPGDITVSVEVPGKDLQHIQTSCAITNPHKIVQVHMLDHGRTCFGGLSLLFEPVQCRSILVPLQRY